MPLVKPAPWGVSRAAVDERYQSLWRGLTFLVSLIRDDGEVIRNKQPVSVGSSASWVVTSLGHARDFPADGNGFVRWSLDDDQRAQYEGEHTHWAFGFFDALTATTYPLLSGGDASGNWFGMAADDNGGGRVLMWWDDNTTRSDVHTNVGSSLAGRWVSFAGVRRGSTYYSYLDGELLTTEPISSGFTLTGTNIEIGREPWNTSNNLDGKVAVAGLWNRALSESELRLLTNDPFGLIRPATVNQVSPTASLYATADGTIVDVVNENDQGGA